MEKKVKLKHKLTNKKNIIKNMKISNKKTTMWKKIKESYN
jgi:hypothetical protein